MNKKEFMAAADKTVADVVSQAYVTTNMTKMDARRDKNSFSYGIGNGYVNMRIAGLSGSLGVAQSGVLSVSPREMDFYDYDPNDNHEAVLLQLREFLWAMMHKAEEHASKRRLAGFVFPAIRPLEEYITDIPVSDDSADIVGDVDDTDDIRVADNVEESYADDAEVCEGDNDVSTSVDSLADCDAVCDGELREELSFVDENEEA